MNETRRRQVAAYAKTPERKRAEAIRARATVAARAYVQDELPEVWAKLVAEATVTVDLARRAKCRHERTRPDVAGTLGGKRRCIDCGAEVAP